MEQNVGGIDRNARFVIGPLLLVVGVAVLAGLISVVSGTAGLALGAVLALVGLVLLSTAVTQKCPLNQAFGVNTCSR